MTAATVPAGRSPRQGRPGGAVPWRQLMQVTLRQHRAALLWAIVAGAAVAIALVATGLQLHSLGPSWLGKTRASVDEPTDFVLVLQLCPVVAGMFIGAPLLPREIEHGTAKLAWTQAASRSRWLLAQVLPVAALLALAAVGLGTAFSWWQSPIRPAFAFFGPWSPEYFNLTPLLLPGWAVFGFALGVFFGAVTRRTLAAMAATLVCYGALLYEVAYSWRMHYLAPLSRALTLSFSGNTYQAGGYWGPDQPVQMSQSLGFRDGRLLPGNYYPPDSWLRAHHIVMWVSYQPDSRYYPFQLIELGWLTAASVILIAATIYLTRRRPA
jgi:hypothetical protein